MSIGGKLKELRILKGLTQEELADRAELSKGFISQVERESDLPVHRYSDGYSPVSRHHHRGVFQRGSGRADCIWKKRLF